MGLVLSVLVVCVGVLEVIACVRHFQSGYLPLWAPHHVASGCANIHELLRTKPNSDYSCCTSSDGVISDDHSSLMGNLYQRKCGQLNISSFDKSGEQTHSKITYSDIECADSFLGAVPDKTLSSNQTIFKSRETVKYNSYFDDFVQASPNVPASSGNHFGTRNCCSFRDINISSSDSLHPSCMPEENLDQHSNFSDSQGLFLENANEIASQNEPQDPVVVEISSSEQTIRKPIIDNPDICAEVYSFGRETETGFPFGSSDTLALDSCSAELLCDAKRLSEHNVNETERFLDEFSVKVDDDTAEKNNSDNDVTKIYSCDKVCKDKHVISAADISLDVDAEASSPAVLTSAFPNEIVTSFQQLPGIEKSSTFDLQIEPNLSSSQSKEGQFLGRSTLLTSGVLKKSKADINWPTFTAVPVIKRPSIALSTETSASFDGFGVIGDTDVINASLESTEKSQNLCRMSVIAGDETIQTQEQAGKDLTGIPAVDTATDESKNTVYSNLSDNDILEETSVPVIPGNDFSKKEIMLKRRRSYKNRRQSSSAESASGSERDDIFSEEKGGTRESRRRSRKSLENIVAEETTNRTPHITSLPLTRDVDNPESECAEKSLGESQTCLEVNPDESSYSSRNKYLPKCQSSSGLETGTEDNPYQVGNLLQDVRESDILENLKSVMVSPNESSETNTHVVNEDLDESEKKTSSKEAFWLIFSGEYTKAMSKDWHSGHFCCWQCDESLTGQRYVLRDDHPYCIKCYESVFANVCEECNKTIGIDSKDLSYKDKHWHEACFLCNKCRISLVDKQFGSKADKIYCGNCYDAQFASRCDGCGEIFRAGTKKMEYKTRQWHEKCFCCCVCKTPIGTKSFIPREQEIYCATCYEEKFATRCVKCKKIITSGGVTYKNEPWHRECFTCTNCNTSLAGQRFTSRDEKPYCAECFGELFAKRCTACSKPITGIGGTRFISFEDRHWHNDCFICAACKTSLVGRGFITDADDIICPECAKQKLM